MEQSNKNVTNTYTLTSEKERNLAKEIGETHQANINDENMEDLDHKQLSEKDIVHPEDISNAPTEKCLENVEFEFEKYVDVVWLTRKENKSVLNKQLQEQLRKDTGHYPNVLKRVIAVVKYLAIRGLAFRSNEEVFGSPHNGNFIGALELLAEFSTHSFVNILNSENHDPNR
ncbi:zinc finger MYM-type protein 1 [Trichonephila clavipes]|nr:zinc finger MYM-type protein 1 [Trichonephila clavipes]